MRSNRTVTVCLGESLTEVGSLRFTADGGRQHSTFTYLETWLHDRRAFALSPDLPLGMIPAYAGSRGRDDTRASLPAAFQDTAPDAWGRLLLERVHGVGLTELETLTLTDDATRQGALRFVDETGTVLSSTGRPIPNVVDLAELQSIARRIEARHEMSNDDLQQIAGAGGSLGGARPKATVKDEDGLWIAKFSSVGDRTPVERIEIATLDLARACGLKTPEFRLMLANTGSPVALVRRFDRRGGQRIPYISARTAVERSGSEAGSYTEMADAIRRLGRKPAADLSELYDRMMFTVLVTNTDDHLKNHGFLYAGDGLWRLSPLFDVNPQPERHRYLKTAIIEGEPFTASLRLTLEAAVFFDIDDDDARGRARRMATIIAGTWRDTARRYGVSGDDLRSLARAFEHEEIDLALSL